MSTAVGTTEVPRTDPAGAGRRLQLTRAAQWFAGGQGDPYGMILRAGDADPEPYEEHVRAQGPLFRSDPLDTWVTASRRVADAVAASDAFGALTADGERPAARELPLSGTVLDAAARLLDDTATRSPADAAYFGGRPTGAPDEEALGALARGVADRVPAGGPGETYDLAAYARRLAAHVIGGHLGVPAELMPRFETALVGCRRALDSLLCPQLLTDAWAGAAAQAALRTVLGEAVAGRDLPPDAVDVACAVAVGAAEPAAVLLGNAVRELLARPDQWAALTADPALADAAITEVLLWAPPVRLESRVARRPAEVAGQALPCGAHVVVLVAAVNREAARASGTDTTSFDIRRRAAHGGPTPFGLSADLFTRLSAVLVRRIAGAGLARLAQRRPGLRPAGPVVRCRRSPVLHSFGELPVTPYATDKEGPR